MRPGFQRFRVNEAQFKLLSTLRRLGVVCLGCEQYYVDSFGKVSYEIDVYYK